MRRNLTRATRRMNKIERTESVCRSRSGHARLTDALPVQPVEQRFELNPGELENTVADLRPGKTAVVAEAFVDHDESGSVPQQNLQAILSLRTEHDDQSGMRIEPECVLHESGQRVMPTAKIDRTNGEHDPQSLSRNDHALRSNAVTISAMRVDAASFSRRTSTLPTTISIFASIFL